MAQFALDVLFVKSLVPPTAPFYADLIDGCGRASSTHHNIPVLHSPGFSLLVTNEHSHVYLEFKDAFVRCDDITQAEALIDCMRVMSIAMSTKMSFFSSLDPK